MTPQMLSRHRTMTPSHAELLQRPLFWPPDLGHDAGPLRERTLRGAAVRDGHHSGAERHRAVPIVQVVVRVGEQLDRVEVALLGPHQRGLRSSARCGHLQRCALVSSSSPYQHDPSVLYYTL